MMKDLKTTKTRPEFNLFDGVKDMGHYLCKGIKVLSEGMERRLPAEENSFINKSKNDVVHMHTYSEN